MYNLIILFVLAVLLKSNLVSAEVLSSNKSSDKLPVLIDKGKLILEQGKDISKNLLLDNKIKLMLSEDFKGSTHGPILAESVLEKAFVDYDQIGTLISNVTEKLCKINKNGSYEVWLQFEGSGSGIFISASAQTGIKAIINCTR
jgi:hypothetical protein